MAVRTKKEIVDTVEEKEKKAVEIVEEEKEEVIVYIGPHIPKLGIMKNMVYRGKRSDTITFLRQVLEFAPEAENLLVDLKDINVKQRELLRKNTKLYEYYEAVENKVRGDK